MTLIDFAKFTWQEGDLDITDEVRAATPRKFGREPTPVELKAKTDFEVMQQVWEDATEQIVEEWAAVREAQIDELVDQVRTAVRLQDVNALASVQVTTQGEEILLRRMLEVADSAIVAARAEALKQGARIPLIDVKVLEASLKQRARGVSTLLARGLSETAARQALQRYGVSTLTPGLVANAVRFHLEELSTSQLQEQLGGALTQAQNSGRAVVFEYGQPTEIYASEILDTNTCKNCKRLDGKVYKSLGAAERDYPAGGYKECMGGARCRGTLIAIYNEDGPEVRAHLPGKHDQQKHAGGRGGDVDPNISNWSDEELLRYKELAMQYYNDRGTREDLVLKDLWERKGYTAKPEVVSEAEFAAREARVTTYRGIQAYYVGGGEVRSGQELADEYRSGDYFAGIGIYGNGTYTTTELSTAHSYGSGDGGSVLKIGLKPDASIVAYETLEAIEEQWIADWDIRTHEALSDMMENRTPASENRIRQLKERQELERVIMSDYGKIATINGFDAMQPKDRRNDYVVIYNRGATFVSASDARPVQAHQQGKHDQQSHAGGKGGQWTPLWERNNTSEAAEELRSALNTMGKNGSPEVVSYEELEALSQSGELLPLFTDDTGTFNLMYRGVTGRSTLVKGPDGEYFEPPVIAQDYADEFRYGDENAFIGNGIFGPGHYFTLVPSVAEMYASGGGFDKTVGQTIVTGVKKDAKIFDSYDLKGGESLATLSNSTQPSGQAFWGVVNGYDGVRVTADFYVVWNRGVLVTAKTPSTHAEPVVVKAHLPGHHDQQRHAGGRGHYYHQPIHRMTRKQMLDELKDHGYAGPTSYTKTKLGQIVEQQRTLKFGTEEEIEKLKEPVGNDVLERFTAAQASGMAESKVVGQGADGQVTHQRYNNGEEFIVKTFHNQWNPRGADSTERMMDAEVLAGAVASELGFPATIARHPQTANTLVGTFHKNATVLGYAGDRYDAIVKSPEGRTLGLFDAVIRNGDRHPLNVMVQPDGSLRPIDHSRSLGGFYADIKQLDTSSIFTNANAIIIDRTLISAPRYTRTEVSEFRDKIARSRPTFEALGRMDWYDDMMDRADKLVNGATA